jgi:hypothetical protein
VSTSHDRRLELAAHEPGPGLRKGRAQGRYPRSCRDAGSSSSPMLGDAQLLITSSLATTRLPQPVTSAPLMARTKAHPPNDRHLVQGLCAVQLRNGCWQCGVHDASAVHELTEAI